MTTTLTPVQGRASAPAYYAGWAGFALFGLVVFLDGNADLPYALIHIGLASILCLWFARTTGRAAPIAGLVLGVLYLAQMVLFVASDLTTSDDHHGLRTTIEDVGGLVAALLIVAGATIALRVRRR